MHVDGRRRPTYYFALSVGSRFTYLWVIESRSAFNEFNALASPNNQKLFVPMKNTGNRLFLGGRLSARTMFKKKPSRLADKLLSQRRHKDSWMTGTCE